MTSRLLKLAALALLLAPLRAQNLQARLDELRAEAGWFPGYQTEMVYFPEKRIAVSVQVNGDLVGYKRSPRYCVNELSRLVLREAPAR